MVFPRLGMTGPGPARFQVGRGRDAGFPASPAQIRTCALTQPAPRIERAQPFHQSAVGGGVVPDTAGSVRRTPARPARASPPPRTRPPPPRGPAPPVPRAWPADGARAGCPPPASGGPPRAAPRPASATPTGHRARPPARGVLSAAPPPSPAMPGSRRTAGSLPHGNGATGRRTPDALSRVPPVRRASWPRPASRRSPAGGTPRFRSHPVAG